MDGPAVSSTTQVEEQEDLITCLPRCTEANAICVKLKVKQENIGEKAASLVSIDANNTKQT